MQRYFSLRVQTALYLSVFFLSLHHVFVYFTNASIMKAVFNMSTGNILSIYGVSSVFGIFIYLLLFQYKQERTKNRIYLATFVEFLCLALMFMATSSTLISADYIMPIYISAFIIHHIITPYILFNLDKLFEDYTHVQERGRGRGIYLTVWNTPFVVVPIMLSALSTNTLTMTYIISFCLLIPFTILIATYIQDPVDETDGSVAPMISIWQKFKNFWSDKLNRNSFLTQSGLHFYYGTTGILLPIYLYQYFGFEWNQIGILLAVITTPFILMQISFGKIEDLKHNGKQLFGWGIIIALMFTFLATLVSPSLEKEVSFFLLMSFLFVSRVGCSLIEISSESLFYKHVTERDEFALLAFRTGRLMPYALGLIFFFI